MSSSNTSAEDRRRPELATTLDVLRKGDTFVVWRLDRLGRNMREPDSLATQLKKQGLCFTSLTEGVRYPDCKRQALLPIIAGLAEYEREGIRKRTRAGVAAARARARKHKIMPAQRSMVTNAYHSQTLIRDICHQFRISQDQKRGQP